MFSAAPWCPTLWDPMECSLSGTSVHGLSPGKNTGAGCHTLLQGICPTQGSNTGLLHCRQILYRLGHQGTSWILEWPAYPFFRGSSQTRNQTREVEVSKSIGMNDWFFIVFLCFFFFLTNKQTFLSFWVSGWQGQVEIELPFLFGNCDMWDISFLPGIKLVPPTLTAQTLNCWAAREAPGIVLLMSTRVCFWLPDECMFLRRYVIISLWTWNHIF